MAERGISPEDLAAGEALRAALAAYDAAEAEAARQAAEHHPITRALQQPGQTITDPARAADALAHAMRDMAYNQHQSISPALRNLLSSTIEAAELRGETVVFSYEEDPFTKMRREQSAASLRIHAEQYGLDPATATWEDITKAHQRKNQAS